MNDESILPFGEHKGKKLINIPAKYLLWLYNNNRCDSELKFYIEDNMEVLKSELPKKQEKYLYF